MFIKYFVAIIPILMVVLVSTTFAGMNKESKEASDPAIRDDWWLKRITFDCKDRSLKEVVAELAASFKIDIIYQAKGAEEPKQCRYNELTVEQILSRLFRKQNSSLIIDDKDKRKITVQVFGVSEYNIVSHGEDKGTETLPFLANMTNEKLILMQNEQLKAYKQELENPDSIIPGVNITRFELNELHKSQMEQYSRQKSDLEQMVFGTNLTKKQLSELHQQQLDQHYRSRQNLKEVDPFTGLNSQELSDLHRQQIKKEKATR